MGFKAIIVVGANYGDEGKGGTIQKIYESLPAELRYNPVVVRYTGGCQAGHTVVPPKHFGVDRIVHNSLGALTCYGGATIYGPEFVVNPVLMRKEWEEFLNYARLPIYQIVDSRCRVTTPWDMMVNVAREKARGENRHGSCGAGFGATVERNKEEDYDVSLYFRDLPYSEIGSSKEETDNSLLNRFARIREYWLKTLGEEVKKHLDLTVYNEEGLMEAFLEDCRVVSRRMLHTDRLSGDKTPLDILENPGVVFFEAAQGLLLSKENTADFPHLTYSNTGVKDALRMHSLMRDVNSLEVVFASRTFLTRHGAGPLPDEDPGMFWPDLTNIPNEFQGTLRFAPLEIASFVNRIICEYHIALSSFPKLTKGKPVIGRINFSWRETCQDPEWYIRYGRKVIWPSYEELVELVEGEIQKQSRFMTVVKNDPSGVITFFLPRFQ